MNLIPIHCLGDSITAAGGLPESGRWTSCLQFLIEQEWPDTFGVFTNGVGGDTTAMGMERMKRDQWNSGLTIIEFGLNDCACRNWSLKPRVSPDEYRANLEAMGRKVLQLKGTPVFIINQLPNFKEEPLQKDGKLYSTKVAEYNAIVAEVAAVLRTETVNIPKKLSKTGVPPEEFYADGVHLTVEGNRHYARYVFEAIHPLLRSLNSD